MSNALLCSTLGTPCRGYPNRQQSRSVSVRHTQLLVRMLRGKHRVPGTNPRSAPDSTGMQETAAKISIKGLHHVALICANLEKSMEFYEGLLGLEVNPDRPHSKLPYRGAWLWIGPEMIHLMELPNPDPSEGRPEHGGRDRHFCMGVESIAPITQRLDIAHVPYTMSKSGRAAVFFRDPDMNTLECVEIDSWR